MCGPGSVVGIATGYGLEGPGIESRWGRDFPAPVQTGPGSQPASCTMGTGSFPGLKSSRGVTLTPHPLLVPWSWMSRAIPLLPLWAVWPVQSLNACTRVEFTFTSHFKWGLLRACAACPTPRLNLRFELHPSWNNIHDTFPTGTAQDAMLLWFRSQILQAFYM